MAKQSPTFLFHEQRKWCKAGAQQGLAQSLTFSNARRAALLNVKPLKIRAQRSEPVNAAQHKKTKGEGEELRTLPLHTKPRRESRRGTLEKIKWAAKPRPLKNHEKHERASGTH